MHEEHSDNSVPLIALPSRRRDYHRLSDDNDNNINANPFSDTFDTSYAGAGGGSIGTSTPQPGSPKMARGPLASLRAPKGSKKSGIAIITSYVFDWIIIFAFLGAAFYMNGHAPNRRPFSLEDPNISFPYTEHETVPSWLLVTCSTGIPLIIIPIITLVFVPGHTVPRGTPKSLIWKRKLWELHVGWLGMALALAGAWFITNGMKNLFGKPRPDALARCNPDIENITKYFVGGVDVADGFQRLVSADICRGMADREDAADILEDGFRSYPSGHSSSAAAGLIYLSLFIASKFAITFPFLAPGSHSNSPTTFSAFPSRRTQPLEAAHLNAHHDPAATHLLTAHNAHLASARRQAAAPPLYLLIFATAPFFLAVFIASSRWFDFRHHGFDILFGFLIGLICAFFAFRWYHLPISQGAGWAWGPRCADKAWWAGVGSFSYAMDWEREVEDGGVVGNEGAAMEEGRGNKFAMSLASSGTAGQGEVGDLEARRRAS